MEAKRTRIVCTIGPASSAVSVLTRMMRSGMNVARLNFSHGTHDEHRILLKNIRQAAKKADATVALLQDLQGPKIRVGKLPDGGIELHEGQVISFSTAIDEYKIGGPIPVTYRRLQHDVKAGHRILLDDGFLEAVVTKIRGKVVNAKVIVGGLLKSRKGMNMPDSNITAEPFTEKDHEDLLFGVSQGVDWIVLSFLSSAHVVSHVRKIVRAAAREHKVRPPKIMAKIETRGAVDGFADILEVVDGVMLGRGDLGLEIPMEEVPIVQKDIIDACRRAHKPVIVATHMLDSMSRNPRATRAEVSDVANAVLDHADAVMLSAESASGRYPAATVQAMAAVIREAEASKYDIMQLPLTDVVDEISALAHTVGALSQKGLIHAIVSGTHAGELAKALPMYRPRVPILIACDDAAEARQMMLYAGVETLVLEQDVATFAPRMHAHLSRNRHIGTRHKVAYIEGGRGSLRLTIHGG